jgi:hypothetical protein
VELKKFLLGELGVWILKVTLLKFLPGVLAALQE